MVQQAQKLFNAEIQTVIDLREATDELVETSNCDIERVRFGSNFEDWWR